MLIARLRTDRVARRFHTTLLWPGARRLLGHREEDARPRRRFGQTGTWPRLPYRRAGERMKPPIDDASARQLAGGPSPRPVLTVSQTRNRRFRDIEGAICRIKTVGLGLDDLRRGTKGYAAPALIFPENLVRSRLLAGGRWIRTVGPPQHYAAGEAGVEHPVAAETRFRQGWTSIAPLADSRRLTLRLAVEGSPAMPAKRSISSGCASSFLSRNLAPTTDGRSRERCRGPR